MNIVNDFVNEASVLMSNGGAPFKYVGLCNRIKSSSVDIPFQKGLIISNENFDYLASYLTVMSFADAKPTIFFSADYGQLESEYFKQANEPVGNLDVCVLIGEISTLTSTFNPRIFRGQRPLLFGLASHSMISWQ